MDNLEARLKIQQVIDMIDSITFDGAITDEEADEMVGRLYKVKDFIKRPNPREKCYMIVDAYNSILLTFQTRADAEEYILSLGEEYMYYDFLDSINRGEKSIDEWIEDWCAKRRSDSYFRHLKSMEAYMFFNLTDFFHIEECSYVEG